MAKSSNKATKVISSILILIILVAVGGGIAYFTNGFTTDFTNLYLNIEGKDILTPTYGYMVGRDEPLAVKVMFLNPQDKGSEYTVKVVPNSVPGKDFDVVVDGKFLSFSSIKDLGKGFNIEMDTDSFTIEPKGGLNDILKAIYPGRDIEDATPFIYKDMFKLVVSSVDGEDTMTVFFTVYEKPTGITLEPDTIIF